MSYIYILKYVFCFGISGIKKRNCKCIDFPHIKDSYNQAICKNYLKIYWLKKVNSIAEAHYKFNKHSILKFSSLFILSLVIVKLSTIFNTDQEHLNTAIQQGFFIAPLLTLMINNQDKINKTLLAIVSIYTEDELKKEDSKEDSKDDDKKTPEELDLEGLSIKKSLIEIRGSSHTFSGVNLNIWNLLDKSLQQIIKTRGTSERLNNKTLVLSSFWLIIGYITFILGQSEIAEFFLIFSLLMIINRIVMGVRSVAKYYLVTKVSHILHCSINKTNDTMMKDTMTVQLNSDNMRRERIKSYTKKYVR